MERYEKRHKKKDKDSIFSLEEQPMKEKRGHPNLLGAKIWEKWKVLTHGDASFRMGTNRTRMVVRPICFGRSKNLNRIRDCG